MPLTPYLNKIICGDCLEVMRGMPDGCVDLVLTDPPYGIGESNKKNMSRGKLALPTNYGNYEWDQSIISPDHLHEIQRVSNNQIIFGGNYYADMLPASPCWIFWDKDNGNNDFADGELAWTSFKSALRKFRYRWNGMLQENMRNKEERIHPTQKPTALGKWILSKYAKPGQVIFDPFMGSGSFLVAALQLGHPWIGCDNNPDYCRMAEERIAREAAQLNMFHTRTAP